MILINTGVHGTEIERRSVQVVYDYQQRGDGFGNIRIVSIKGLVKNASEQDAAQIQIAFKLYWQKRGSDSRKVIVDNLPSTETKEFHFEVDLKDQPDVLERISAEISRIKFSTIRKSSPVSAHNFISKQTLTLSRLTEEGRTFSEILVDLLTKMPFSTPVKDEFETTDEYESHINYAENEHFSKTMDALEKNYGEHLGVKGSVVRFIPETINKQLVYLSENTFLFQIPLRLGLYNADAGQFENISLMPRNINFPANTSVVPAELQISHGDGIFFLKSPNIAVPRETAKIWRQHDDDLLIEMELKIGVVQDGSHPVAYCHLYSIKILNSKTQEIYKSWPAISNSTDSENGS